MVLNQTHGDSNNGDNLKNCEDLLNSINEKYIEVAKCLINNCGNSQETNQLLDVVIEYLTNSISDLDKQYSGACQQRLLEIHELVKSELSKAKIVFPQDAEDDYQEIEELFSDLFGNSDHGWWREVALGLQELRVQLWHQRQIPDEELYEGMIAAIENCEQDKGIISAENALQEINNQIRIISAFRAYPDYQDELRVLISNRFLTLDENLKRKVESAKNQVVEVLKATGNLSVISDAEGSEFFAAIANTIPERLAKLKAGFQIIADFQLSYRGLILPRIRQHLDGLTNISVTTGQSSQISGQTYQTLTVTKDTTADDILTALEIEYDKAIYDIKPALESLLSEPNEAAYAMVEEFIDNVIRQKEIQKEWRNFLRGVRGKIWSGVFGKKEQNRQIRQEWMTVVNQVTQINQLEYFYFAN
jgi:hypothetical protein